jgi:hypothetical protein
MIYIIHIYVYMKYQGKTLFNNQYTLLKMKDRKVKQDLSQGGYQQEGERKGQRIW